MDAPRGPSPTAWEVARGWLLLPHLAPVLVVLLATAGFAWLFADGGLDGATLARLLLGMLGGQLAIGAVNEIVDAPLDAVANPRKPIPSGLVTVRGARNLAIGGLLLMAVAGASFGAVPLLLLCAGTGLGLVYDLWLKRTPFAWLPYALALPLLPIWVHACLRGFDPRLLLLYPLGAAATVGVYLAQSAPDARSDRAAGIANPVARLGETNAVLLACGLTVTAPALAVMAGGLIPALGADRFTLSWTAAVSLALAAVALAVYASRPALGLRTCFPLLALSLLVTALGWTLAVG